MRMALHDFLGYQGRPWLTLALRPCPWHSANHVIGQVPRSLQHFRCKPCPTRRYIDGLTIYGIMAASSYVHCWNQHVSAIGPNAAVQYLANIHKPRNRTLSLPLHLLVEALLHCDSGLADLNPVAFFKGFRVDKSSYLSNSKPFSLRWCEFDLKMYYYIRVVFALAAVLTQISAQAPTSTFDAEAAYSASLSAYHAESSEFVATSGAAAEAYSVSLSAYLAESSGDVATSAAGAANALSAYSISVSVYSAFTQGLAKSSSALAQADAAYSVSLSAYLAESSEYVATSAAAEAAAASASSAAILVVSESSAYEASTAAAAAQQAKTITSTKNNAQTSTQPTIEITTKSTPQSTSQSTPQSTKNPSTANTSSEGAQVKALTVMALGIFGLALWL